MLLSMFQTFYHRIISSSKSDRKQFYFFSYCDYFFTAWNNYRQKINEESICNNTVELKKFTGYLSTTDYKYIVFKEILPIPVVKINVDLNSLINKACLKKQGFSFLCISTEEEDMRHP